MGIGLVVLGLLIGLGTCGKNIEDPDPPARPEWVPKSALDDTLETGIDADPGGDVIVLQWYNGHEEDLAVYRLYRCAGDLAQPNFTLLNEVPALTIGGVILEWVDEEVQVGVNYAYYLRAVDQAGNLSVRSDTVQYCLIPKADLVQPLGTTDQTKPTFKWSNQSNLAAQYVLRVEELAGNLCWICLTTRQNYVGEIESLVYGNGGSVYRPELVRGKSYRWRVDGVFNFDRYGNEIAGSESNWGYFTVQ